jgi:arylsulfatase A-like enzyme
MLSKTKHARTAHVKLALNTAVICSVSSLTACTPQSEEKSKPNVLFIAVDDLRPELACYGAPVHSPNIDRLAEQGIRFNRHYVQMAVSIPSRTALLTGLRSERTHQLYGPPVWKDVPGVQSWGNTFKEGGYETVSLGKIWHVEGGKNSDTFDVQWTPGTQFSYADEQNRENNATYIQLKKTKSETEIRYLRPITESANVDDSVYSDGKIALRAIAELKRLAAEKKPFVMAVGFHKPHLPFCAPEKYWKLYREDDIEPATAPFFPKNMPEVAFNKNPSFFSYTYGNYPQLEEGQQMDERTARHLRQAYRACVSFVDAQIGKVLDELKRSGLDKNTIIVFWGDHGYHLGETEQWSKQTNFETGARSPLIVKIPWGEHKNTQTNSLVETVDIFPTLLELCHLPAVSLCDGKSFAPLLENPNLPWKEAVYHVFNRRIKQDGKPALVIGHAVRTERYRYVSWRIGWGLQGEEIAAELYDYTNGLYETENVINTPEYKEIQNKMETLLRQGPAGKLNEE